MILQASKRGGGLQLGRHLTNTRDNEHVEIHEMRGFLSGDLMGAMQEAQAVAQGTKCRQNLFSLSLSPPQTENVRTEVFERAIEQIEERLGLTGQPRAVVFHEKEGRRHAHCVWSRIDASSMTARELPFFKLKLRDISKQLYLENGWQMPRGFMDSKLRDPRDFSLEEWQQAKRAGLSAKELKATVQECWSVATDARSFGAELKTRGLFLVKGDRRGHVILNHEGEAFAVSRLIGKRTKDVTAKLGEGFGLPSVEQAREEIAAVMTLRLQNHIREAKRIAAAQMKPLLERRRDLTDRHSLERRKLDEGQRLRHVTETRERCLRISTGFRGFWQRITGEHSKIKVRNDAEAFFALQRDREQRQQLIDSQLRERRGLQAEILEARAAHAQQVLALFKDASRYRELGRDVLQARSSLQSRPEAGRRFQRGPRAPTLGLG